MEQPIKSVVTIVRGVPRGKISAGGVEFFDPHDDEVLLGYPFGAGALFLERGMARMLNTPLAIIQSGPAEFFYLSALCDSVRANRFYFQPGEKGYRVEMVYEQAGWVKSPKLESPVWRAGHAGSMEGACAPHFAHVEKTFQVPNWETRTDVAPWCRDAAMAVTLHGMHWTGYIFNDYPKMLKILQWVATQIPARNVFVLLPAWDGRFYWNYPLYKTDPRMGGDEAFHRLIQEGQKMGFHFMPMFGTNCAKDLSAVGLGSIPDSFKSDHLWSYELGAKTRWLEHRLVINAAVFDIEWKDIQTNIGLPGCGYALVDNVGSATIKGFDLSLGVVPVPGLSLDAAVGRIMAALDGDAVEQVASGGGQIHPATSRPIPRQHVQPVHLGWVLTARAAGTSRICGRSHGFLWGIVDPSI